MYTAQTTTETMRRIESGVDPWVAFRDFLEDWTYMPQARAAMILDEPPVSRPVDRRWAVLLAGAIEALAERDGLAVPSWAQGARFSLTRPWYLYEGKGRIREWSRETTPPAFARRNVFSGSKILRRA